MSKIARYYDASANPEGRVFHGVPLADIEQSHWDTLPEWLRASADASGFYRKTKPSGDTAKAGSATQAAEQKEG